MIKWISTLYFSDNIKKHKQKKLMKDVEKGKLTFEVYSITLAMNEENLLDIINANELLFPYYQRKEIYVIGLAKSREEAKLLAVDILMDMYKETGGFKAREYFLPKSI